MEQLTLKERHVIAALYEAKHSRRKIAKQLKRNVSTVSREMKRNRSVFGIYCPINADQKYKDRKKNIGGKKRWTTQIEALAREKLNLKWSPEQIVGYCRKNNIPMVSHIIIYRFIEMDKRQGGKLYLNLRRRKKSFEKRKKGKELAQIKNKVSIDERPNVINNKERFGDWEFDLIVGKDHKGFIGTAVERKTKFTSIFRLKHKSAKLAKEGFVKALTPIMNFVKSITSDNGKEFSEHEKIAQSLDCEFYFAHPYSSWERGLNENTNGLIRQYLKKGMRLDEVTDEQTRKIMDELNNRPRKTLGFKSPLQAFDEYTLLERQWG